MKNITILIVSATELEINFFKKELKKNNNNSVEILITGIGSIFTTYFLTKILTKKKYDIIINVGIAGSFDENLKIGDVVEVIEDEFADLGIENKEKFFTLFDMKFIDKNSFSFKNGKIINENNFFKNLNLKKVKAITVNKASGNLKNIKKIKKKFSPQIETMEGAFFFFVCKMENQKCLQLRSISNFVEERNKKNWNIPMAVKNLNKALENLIIKNSS